MAGKPAREVCRGRILEGDHAVIRTLSLGRALPVVGAVVLAVVTAAPALAAEPKSSSEQASPTRMEHGRGPLAELDLPFGIDVSHWQSFIRWRHVASAGVDFAIIKATDGTWMVDDRYERNKRRAEFHGIRVTAYHFARPDRGRYDAIREADYFLRNARLNGGNLVPALDMETSGGLGPRALRTWVLTWLRRVEEKLGVRPMVYTSPGFWSGWLSNSRGIARAGYSVLWLAHYDTNRPSTPARGWNGHGWTFWQWTECGHVRGVRGCVDRDYFIGPSLRDLTIRQIRMGVAAE